MEPETTPKPDDTSYQQRLMKAPGMKVGLIGGIAGGAIGLVAALGASIATHSLAGVVISLLIVGVFIAVFSIAFGPMVRGAKLVQTGIPAEATILKVWDTGTTVNEQPEIELLLEVQPKNGTRYETKTKAIVSRLQAAWYIPGAKVGVKVDAKNPNRVVITDRLDVTGTAGEAPGGQTPDQAKALAQVAETDAYNQRLMAGGETAKAKVKEATALNIFVNGRNPAMRFLLEVQPIGGELFLAEAGGVIREDSVARYQPGREIWVKLDPATKTKVGLFHS